MLLKITEKIIQRNVFEQKKKKPGLSPNKAFEQLHRVEYLLRAPVKQKFLFTGTRPTHSGQCLLK